MELPLSDYDWIMVEDLRVHAILGVDGWEQRKAQPVIISLAAQVDIAAAGESDLLADSISYSALSKTAQEFAESSHYRTIEALSNALAHLLLRKYGMARIRVRLEKPRALLHADAAGIQIERVREDYATDDDDASTSEQTLGVLQPTSDTEHIDPEHRILYRPTDVIIVRGLRLNTIIGINAWERLGKQVVLVHLQLHPDARERFGSATRLPRTYNFRTIVRTVTHLVEKSSYKTVEAMVSTIARICVAQCHVPRVTVRTEKPSALRFARAAAVQITRGRDDYADLAAVPLDAAITSDSKTDKRVHIVYLALGANIGHRLESVQTAMQRLEQDCDAQIVDTSFLYETAPMYVVDQPMFLNAACKIRTSLAPHALLRQLKAIEESMGRDLHGQRNGPRPIDLDILFYDNLVMEDPELVIPHPRLAEREFVLRPLCDIASHREHPTLFRTCGQLLDQLMHKTGELGESTAIPTIPLCNETLWTRGRRTCIMGILNVTPDSFSDGGEHNTVEKAMEHARAMLAAGANVIDVGGMSTRPGSTEISVAEELARVVPVIEAISKTDIDCCVSIDTYRAEVAEKAIAAGAHWVNDVSGGELDSEMFSTVARLRVPICLMHMRGTPTTMQQLADYPDTADGFLAQVADELEMRVKKALAAGIYRWNIIIDPGLGFAKRTEHSYTLLRCLPALSASHTALGGFPLLVGPSRKKFLGAVTGEEDPARRVLGTAAACTAAVAGGADILRVHDVSEMLQSVQVADAVWRQHATTSKP